METLSAGNVEGIRGGEIADPLVTQLTALAAAFGVPPSYLLDRGREPPVLDEKIVDVWLTRPQARDTYGECSSA